MINHYKSRDSHPLAKVCGTCRHKTIAGCSVGIDIATDTSANSGNCYAWGYTDEYIKKHNL